MNRSFVIAKNTILESLRNKILYVILVFAVILLLLSGALAHFDAQVQRKVLKDIAYTVISFFGLMVSLFITIEQVPNELDRKTIYFLLTKPVYRFEFLIGKFLGVLAVMFSALALMSGVLCLLLGFHAGAVDANLLKGLSMLALKLMVFTSLLVFFSTFLSKILNVTLSFFIYLFGHVGEFLQYSFTQSGKEAVSSFLGLFQLVLPNFRNFDVQVSVVHNVQISWSYLGVLASYAVLFSLMFLLLGHVIFRQRDL
ncbi:MAG: ABC transporter permease subunit [Candidatus Wallbacteria bacterium]|nr:ABC transporter permease subunit [Candidatus Wallbacteria bacterium]